MNRKKTTAIILIIMILWVLMIFYFSSQPPDISYSQSKVAIKIINAINDVFDISDTAIYIKAADFLKDKWFFGLYKSTNVVVRKSAHYGIYFLLGIIAASFGYLYSRKKLMGFMLGISLPVTVAVLDEYNQGFVGRSSSLDDVIIDGIGGITGTAAVILAIFLLNAIKAVKNIFLK